ncbi:MAG: MmcB family DNA repair protein [Bacillota bacterium]|nr:MmcB family DNA repair protein [Bacillota bacterium]
MSLITADSIKAVIASYWRYVRQCPVIALEVDSSLDSYSGGERADVLAVDKNRFLIETEVKITLADLRRDAEKSKHRAFRENLPTRCVARHFYFAIPRDIANTASLVCNDLYPYAGVLGVNGLDEYGVEVYRQAKFLAGKRLTYPQVLRIIFNQSATVCRLAKKVGELTRVQRNLDDQLKEYRDMKRLEGGRDGPTNIGAA